MRRRRLRPDACVEIGSQGSQSNDWQSSSANRLVLGQEDNWYMCLMIYFEIIRLVSRVTPRHQTAQSVLCLVTMDQDRALGEQLGYTRASVGNAVAVAVDHGLLALSRFFVRLQVKVDEETKVAGEEATAKKSSGFRSCAVAHIGKVWPIGSGEMFIGCIR